MSAQPYPNPTQPFGFDAEIRKVLFKDSLIFGIGVILVLAAFYMGGWFSGDCREELTVQKEEDHGFRFTNSSGCRRSPGNR